MSQMAPAYFPLLGGLNLATPAIETPSGNAIAAVNYEPIERGCGRVRGYERYDGQPAPSDASYSVLNFDAGTAAISEGDTVTGATSGATGKALIDAVVETGTYGGSDAAGYLVLTTVSGTFQDDENLQVSAVTKCVANGTATDRGADNDTDDTTWIRDAIETARALIAKPTGSGPVRGVWVYKGTRYCFRNNAGGTAGTMYKATTAGWSAVSLGSQIDFDTGTAAFTEGGTLTGGTSAATATIKRVILVSGSWSGGDAAGYLILSGVSGTFQNNETITDGSGGSAMADGADAAITLPAGGTYEFRNENFFGASDLLRMYGVNGVGKAFEFDGTVFVPIRTGMTTDTPDHIEVFNNHLFLSFPGGSLQNSSIGDPYTWSPVTGASEIGLGTDVTGLLAILESAMVVTGRNRVAVLYGTGTSDFQLVRYADDSGGIEWTLQRIGNPMFFDDRGLRSLSQTQAYGNFRMGTITNLIEPLIRKKRQKGVTVRASMRVREKDQYRLFYSDGTGITGFFGRRNPEFLPFDLGSDPVHCACSADDSDGSEVLLVGTDDGWVYQLDKGTSFDGSAIGAAIRFAFNHLGSPAFDKRFHKATLEVDCAGPTTLSMTSEFSYADPNQPAGAEIDFSVSGGGGFWDEADWEAFYWDASAEGQAEAHIDGIGKNISIAVLHSSTYEEPHVLHGMTLNFSPRKVRR